MREIYKSSDFVDYALCEFEGAELMIIKNYDYVLRASYGDYMQLPPEDQRVGHHPYKYYDAKAL